MKRVGRAVRSALRHPSVFVGRFKYVFILGHMRGYTSLLAHILGSHPEISGYFELHREYRSRLDLLRMRIAVANGLNDRPQGSYFLDKILHSRYRLCPRILARDNVFTIFMLRRPRQTLRSCMGLRAFASDPGAAGRYYVERLEALALASAVPFHRAYLDAEALLDNTESVLEALRSYLGLGRVLSPEYSTFKFTGAEGFGDSSTYIWRRVIVREREEDHSIEIPAPILGEAEGTFAAVETTLKRNCRALV